MSDPASILDDVRTAIADYCVLPDNRCLDAVTLWVSVSHAMGAFDFAPRLVIKSVEKRSGKTRLVELLDGLAHDPRRLVHASVSYLFRRIEQSQDCPPTLLLDEADTLFGNQRQADNNEELRGLLNSGFQRGTLYGRVQGASLEPREYRTFAMAALAGIGDMPDTIEDRAIVIRMKRRKPEDSVLPFRLRDDGARLQRLRDRLADWLVPSVEELALARPDLPVVDRAADVWEPLVAVANLAGGEWPNRAWSAAVALTESNFEAQTRANFGGQLLADLQAIFDALGRPDKVATASLVDNLNALDEAPWGALGTDGIDSRVLAKSLAPYGVRPVSVRINAAVVRGYRYVDLHDAWARYLDSPATSATSATSGPNLVIPDHA